MTISRPVFKLAPGIQSYDWGKPGSSSLAAQLARESVPDFEVDENKKYAELWMGTHSTLPSRVDATTLLSSYLVAHPNLIGSKVAAKYPGCKDGQLPFLFKVLSIGTALSIQAHPDKSLAEQLYATRPEIYKDPNHKPEMAIALTPFRAFLNFLPPATLLLHLLTVPELAALIPVAAVQALGASLNLPVTTPVADPAAYVSSGSVTDAQKAALKAVFGALMSATAEQYKPAVAALVQRYQSGTNIAASEKALVDLVLLLDSQYPGDIGTLCVFVLNVIDCQAGDAVFLGANIPHAYISGDVIECMATSDNVVRAGLTPKLRDVPTLVDMLTYEAGPAERQFLEPTEFNRDPTTKIFDPPIDEFSVLRTHLAKDEVTTTRAIDGPSIAVVTAGEAIVSWGYEQDLIVTRGDVIFMGAGSEFKWEARKDTEVFRAFVEA
ncbi:Mannose-6-phosphate isomerase [Apiotrichum porosum]|uniref:Mannose-6-phosphate isomerase n=1 Tax=Apiotrichum porosum TaxID=105984 RepID=A0A427XR83_9TREE|nr:Mannose-6-phosphate isomerase [Apiotrichum porosum]RSH81318.1 Mannose-6-phosphate isomerase [Apiotrichum porosum]